MDTERLIQYLEQPARAESWLRTLGLENSPRAFQNLTNITRSGLTLDLMAVICQQLARHLPLLSDPDRALNNLDRFFQATRSPLSLGALFERDPEALPTLLRIFSTSQYLANWLERDPEAFDLLRLTEGQPVARVTLADELCSEVDEIHDERGVMMMLRWHKHREMLRIAYGDIIRAQHFSTVATQISYLADAVIEAALRAAWRLESNRRGTPRLADARQARFVVLALGKLGGVELNYSSDIDLIFISDGDGETDGDRSISNREFFDRLAQRLVRILSEATELGSLYRVDLRLRPQGRQGPIVLDWESALRYYDISGRTWERQAFVKARPAAGDLQLGRFFLEQLQPWIYRRYLSCADIAGIKALRRRIEQRAEREGGDCWNVKLGEGGIRDIEFVIQFLQLLNGGDLPEIRTGNTLTAIARLEHAQCLTMEERTILEESYQFLRKIEHRLQIMFDLQTHTLPDDDAELRRIAIRTGFRDDANRSALDDFKATLAARTRQNRSILDHLLQDAFSDDLETAPETDLILDPDPTQSSKEACCKRYGFRDIDGAYANLMALTTERVAFLSTRRSRHFLASIAPSLLTAIAATPDPDSTLMNLANVSDSLGGKGVLWELFSDSPPSLKLYVQLCATSPYLSGILTSNPGMIDELMDSLQLNRLPTRGILANTLRDLCHNAEDIDPIVHSFKNFQHLRVGVRDILGKDDVKITHRALSDIAEVCLQEIVRNEYGKLVGKYGQPMLPGEAITAPASEMVIVALGKMGGREPNYHSDLDVIFLYEADGQTQHVAPQRQNRVTTTNQHFFSQLAQRIMKRVTRMGPYGRLYEVDPRLRPTGQSGAIAVSLAEFQKYFVTGGGQLWERQALCKSRPLTGSNDARARTMNTIRRIILDQPWQASNAAEIRRMRVRMQQTASDRNLKRGVGGTVDIEFIVQMLQLKHAADHPQVLIPGTLDAIEVMRDLGLMDDEDALYLGKSYRFLRGVESRLRLMNTAARHDLPAKEQQLDLKKLAYLMDDDQASRLVNDCCQYQRKNRALFNRIFDTHSLESSP